MKKIILFVGMMIIGLSVIFGLSYYLDKKKAKGENEAIVQEIPSFESETESNESNPGESDPDSIPEKKTEKAEETIIYTHPESYPTEEPEPECAGDEIYIYFTNMETVDDSGLLPYNAWENATKKLQMFLNFEELEVSEVQAIENSIEQDGDIVTFYAVFPENPGKTLQLKYDIKLREWNFIIDTREDIENEIEENSIDGGFE